MRRWFLGVGVLGLLLAAAPAWAATPGFTLAERSLASELRKRLRDKTTKDELALAYARVYLRRACVIDVEPAEDLASELLKKERRIKEQDQLQYFAWALDALRRGAGLQDLKKTLATLLKEIYSAADQKHFLQSLFGIASRRASPIPLVDLAVVAGNNGIVGARRREFIAWAVAQVEFGEDPAHIKKIYDAVSKVSPSIGSQRSFLEKCFKSTRLGVPPLALTGAVTQMSKRYQTDRLLNEALDKVLRLFFTGTDFDEAVKTVMPPAKRPAPK